MNKNIGDSAFSVVLRYDSARTLFDCIIAVDEVAQVYPEHAVKLAKIRDDMFLVLAEIAQNEIGTIEDVKAAIVAEMKNLGVDIKLK